jgi:hypothetical protein
LSFLAGSIVLALALRRRHHEDDREIVWQDTTAATWTNSRWAGNVTSYTIKGMSKDNYFFGVRAVDKEGNRSQVS